MAVTVATPLISPPGPVQSCRRRQFESDNRLDLAEGGPYAPNQQLLLPAALQEWLPPDHLACFISDVVDQLDLSAITIRYQGEGFRLLWVYRPQ